MFHTTVRLCMIPTKIHLGVFEKRAMHFTGKRDFEVEEKMEEMQEQIRELEKQNSHLKNKVSFLSNYSWLLLVTPNY